MSMEMTKETPLTGKIGITYLIADESETHISLVPVPDYYGLKTWYGRNKVRRMPIQFFNRWYNRLLPLQAGSRGTIGKAQLKPKGDRLVHNPEIGPGEEQ